MTLRLRIYGTPAPQGSKKAYVVGGRARLTEAAGDKHKSWRTDIVEQTRTQMGEGWKPFEVPVVVAVVFFQAMPKSLTKAQRRLPPDRGHDIDKLARAVLDGLTIAGAWNDDRRVVRLEVRKDWADNAFPPGAAIEVRQWGALP